MTASYHYIAHDGGWDVDLGSQVVRLGAIQGFTELAEMGATGDSTLVLDSVADIGHASDNILAYQQFAYDDDAGAEARIFMGWTRDRKYYRGTDSLRQGAQRKCEVNLDDGNTLAGRRVIKPKTLDGSVNRPAESPAARIAWLLGSDYFSGVVDNGLVHPKSSPTLTANNFEGQNAADVMNDACTATGDNWFVRWNRADALWELVVYNFTTYDGDAGTLILSNDPALVDSNLVDGAGPTNCWAVAGDAVLARDPSSLCTGLLYPWSGGTVYEDTTSTDYPLIDHTASSTSVRTAALATAKALRYIADNDTEHHRITCTAQIAAANVNDAYAGQLIIASFTHLPGYESATFFRIARRTVAQIGQTDDFYTVTYELVPTAPVSPVSTFAVLDRGYVDYTGPIDSPGIGDYQMGYSGTGDSPPSSTSYPVQPKTGLVAYLLAGGIPIGCTVSGAGTLAVASVVKCELGYIGTGMTVEHTVLVNGVVVLTSGVYSDPSGGGPHLIDPTLTIAGDITVSAGDTVTTHYVIGGHGSAIGGVPIAGTFAPPYQFSISGDLS